MNTISQSAPLNIYSNAINVDAKTKPISEFWQNAEFCRFTISPLLMVIIVCIGAFAAAVAVKESVFQLALVAITVPVVEGLILALAPMRTIIISSALSVVLSLLIIIF